MMNFRKFPVTVTLLGLFVFCAWNMLQLGNLYMQARAGIWYEEKLAKMLLLNARSRHPDIVFVGSSRTMNQINTEYLGELGMDSFNLGLAGRWWQEYPSLVKSAARNAVKAVVVSIPVDELFRPVQCPDQFTLTDVVVFARNRQLFACEKMTIADRLVSNLPMNRFRTFIDRRINSIGDTARKMDFIKSRYDYDIERDSRKLNYIRGKEDRYTVLFRNGDGIVFSDRLKGKVFNPLYSDLENRKFNVHALKYMSVLTHIITANGKTAVFVIEPSSWNKRYKIDIDRLAAASKPARILFNAGLEFDLEYWSDQGHLNYRGVMIYTKYLHNQLVNLLH